MEGRCCAGLLLASLAWFDNASAAVVMIDAGQAVTPPRSDPGTGLCASTIHLKSSAGGFRSADGSDAAAFLDKDWKIDPNITGRVSRLLRSINLCNGDAASLGDFTAANGTDEYLPFSDASQAVPQGDDFNIAQRLRGYWNVPSALVGKTIAFGLLCDDLCVLKVGKNRTVLSPVANTQRSTSRMIYRLQFGGPGLYPIEAIYYQNGSAGFFEWSRTSIDVSECPIGLCNVSLTDTSYNESFRLVDRSELYSSLLGESVQCQECGAAGQLCSPGSYCGDGICQSCDLPDHCGPSCLTCPQDARICSSGRCVNCTADDQCAEYFICDIASGRCRAPSRCFENLDCPSGRICDPDALVCIPFPRWCISNSACPSGQICATNYCQNPPRACDTDAGCAANQHCTAWHLCADGMRARGCNFTSHRSTAPFASLVGIIVLVGMRRIRRSRGSAGDESGLAMRQRSAWDSAREFFVCPGR